MKTALFKAFVSISIFLSTQSSKWGSKHIKIQDYEKYNGKENFGAVKGLVKDIHGKPVKGCRIKIKGHNSGVVSNKKGEFLINEIPQGIHKLQFKHENSKKFDSEVFIMSNIRLIIKYTQFCVI